MNINFKILRLEFTEDVHIFQLSPVLKGLLVATYQFKGNTIKFTKAIDMFI